MNKKTIVIFILVLVLGAAALLSLGGNIMTDAFGVVGIIAMMPPITVQTMGFVYGLMLKRQQRGTEPETAIDGSEEMERTE